MIRLTTPDLRLRSLLPLGKVILSGNLTQGGVASRVEKEFSSKLFDGAESRVVSSATTGLNLALRAVGVGPGDEVIIPSFTFPATANSILQLGARPVLVDVEESSYNISVDDIAARITPRTKAIMPVHAFGLPADMVAICRLAALHGVAVVEDAACAVGSTIDGKAVGTFGDFGVFSFHPRKVITCGEGGLLVVNNTRYLDRIDLLRSHGSRKAEVGFVFEDWGYNYRLSDLSASLLLDQLSRLGVILRKRRQVALKYISLLSDSDLVSLPPLIPAHTFQSFVIQLDSSLDRDEIVRKLKVIGIESTLGTYNLARQPFLVDFGYDHTSMPVSEFSQKNSLSLPISSRMTGRQVRKVTGSLLKLIGNQRSGDEA